MIIKRRHNGFTLVELIVATTLTVLVAGSTAGILRSITAARRRVDSQATAQQELRLAVGAIATALRNSHRAGSRVVVEGIDDWRDGMPSDRIRMFTVSRNAVRAGQPESDVMECEFGLARRPEEPNAPAMLVRRIDPTRNEEPDGGGVVEPIAENVLALDFAYHDGFEWRDEWSRDTEGSLLAVRIRLMVLAPGDIEKIWTTSRIVSFPYLGGTAEQEEQ